MRSESNWLRRHRRRALAAIAALALAAAACGGNGDEEATASEEQPAAESESGNPTDEQTGGEAAEEPAADERPEPVGDGIKLAVSVGAVQVQRVPTYLALDEMEADGFTTEVLHLSSSEDPINAVVRGDAQFGTTSASAVFAAVQGGAPIKAILSSNLPNFAMVAPVEANDPGDLDGLRVGIHAPVSSTALYSELALANHPDAEPTYVVVPGSANRIQALAADELDASPVQLSDLPRVEELAPGRFHVIHNYAVENPELLDTVFFARDDLLEEDPGLVQAFIEAQLKHYQAAYDNPDELAAAIAELVPDTSPELAEELAQIHVDVQMWPLDGGVTAESVEATIEALTANGLLEEAPDPAAVYDRAPLEAVLARLGTGA